MDRMVDHAVSVARSLLIWIASDASFPVLASEISPLQPLPALTSREKQDALDDNYSPFPRDALMLEDDMINDGNVQRGEDGDKAGNYSPKEERILSAIVPPLVEDVIPPIPAARVHRSGYLAEERPPKVDHLPGEEQGKPSQAHERCGTGAEDKSTSISILVVAVDA